MNTQVTKPIIHRRQHMVDTPHAIGDLLRTHHRIQQYIPTNLVLERTMAMDENCEATGKTPEQLEAEQHAVEGFMDGLVDAFEDALADVDYSLNTKYDRPELIEAMKLAIQIDDLIEYLKQYLPNKQAPDEG